MDQVIDNSFAEKAAKDAENVKAPNNCKKSETLWISRVAKQSITSNPTNGGSHGSAIGRFES